ncbi:GNAT family N-acetyltransferase [Antrihabitans sp. YC2-6]|uniref:bifunctional acetate--CoA ligase family protein/GNAT family N-acetyltransferase n=1 Tax=Antrihabitans sp. YC2-6 TaxID=2799498 RepID=UPI0035A8CAD0
MPVTDKTEPFPEHWLADVLAADGGVVHLRPITPDDAGRLVEFHEKLSPRTKYLRYFGPYPRMSERDVERSTHVDHHRRVALIALLGDEIIAVGVYEGMPDQEVAEVAFVVADDHQGRGLGSILLEHLAGAAAENGIETFVAEVLAENRGMVKVFKDAGYQVSRSIDGSVLHLEFAIDPSEALLQVRNSRERASEARSVRNLLSPRSIAVIGASASETKVGRVVLANLLRGEFSGPVYPVNSKHRSVQGVRAYATVREIPDDVDLAVVAVPATDIESVFDDCLAKGVKGLIVLTAGFAETGAEGFEAQLRLVRDARGHGMRLVGPNALGIANNDPAVSLNATLAPQMPARGRVGFFCQSGPLGAAILGEAAARNLGLSTFVSAGNRADVSGNDLLQYWDTDPDTDVVLLYLESFGNPRKFSRIAKRVSRNKPIIAIRSGRGSARKRPGQAEVVDDSIAADLFRQAGVIAVESISEMFDCGALVGYQPLPAGPRLAIVGNSAALGWLAADAAETAGLQVRDPINLGPMVGPEQFTAAVRKAVDSRHVDAVLAIVVPPIPMPMEPFAAPLRVIAASSGKPVITNFQGEQGIREILTVYGPDGTPTRGSVPSYADPETAVRALGHVWRYAAWLADPPSQIVRPDGIYPDRARDLLLSWEADTVELGWLSDVRTNELLACYGIGIVDFREVTGPDAAVAAADELGYPVAAKATGPMWRNRPDLGGVRLDLTDPPAVRKAYENLAEVSADQLVHIQRMARKGIGCTVRVQDDPSFGSVISFGLAGKILDLLGDRAYRALPLTESEATELVSAPRAAPLLVGSETVEAANTGALRDLLLRISTMCEDLPEVRELVCEPILATGPDAEILYARMRIGPEPTHFDAGPRRLG